MKVERPRVTRERIEMTKKFYKCFECGRIYEDEEKALKCHNAPIQQIVNHKKDKKPRFLGA